MKRALYSLLLIFLLSCGRSPTVSHSVSVFMTDGKSYDGWLISVKDSTLEIAVADDTSTSRMKMPFSQVELVLLRKDGKWGAFGLGSATGCFGGAAIGVSMFGPSGTGEYSYLSDIGRGFAGLFGSAIGAVAGGIIGCQIQHEANKYYLYKAKDLEYLKTVAVDK